MRAVLGAGFLLLVSLAVSTAIAALVDLAANIERLAPFLGVLDVTISLLVITVLFALIFMYLPDVHINWRDVSVGALSRHVSLWPVSSPSASIWERAMSDRLTE